jgi:hypothetical protein
MTPLDLLFSLLVKLTHFEVALLDPIECKGLLWAIKITAGGLGHSFHLWLLAGPRPGSGLIRRHLTCRDGLGTNLVPYWGVARSLGRSTFWRGSLPRYLALFYLKKPFVKVSCFLEKLLNFDWALIFELLLFHHLVIQVCILGEQVRGMKRVRCLQVRHSILVVRKQVLGGNLFKLSGCRLRAIIPLIHIWAFVRV